MINTFVYYKGCDQPNVPLIVLLSLLHLKTKVLKKAGNKISHVRHRLINPGTNTQKPFFAPLSLPYKTGYRLCSQWRECMPCYNSITAMATLRELKFDLLLCPIGIAVNFYLPTRHKQLEETIRWRSTERLNNLFFKKTDWFHS